MIEATQMQNFRRIGILRKKVSRDFWLLMAITLVHIPLGVLIYNAGPFAILHPIGALFVGLYWAVQKSVKLERVVLAIAYLVGAEVLWRMAQVPVFWEFGKYGSAAIAIVALVRRSHYTIPKLPLIYFVALLPACVLTFIELDTDRARAALSSNMSGPLLLLICCWFFLNVRITSLQLRKVFFAIMIPLFSVACVTLFYTVTIEDIQFTSESNFATSGGFGPNQVSSMLGLGSFAAILCLIVFENSIKYRIYFMLAAVFFSAQSVLTFSRGGIYNAAAAILIVSLLEFRSPVEAAKRLVPIAALVIFFLVLVFPILDNFTDGNLQERFEDTGTSQRSNIVESDLQVFWENPVLGVGVGSAYSYRERFLDHKAMSHTEFSRLLSEHGIFGVVALLLMIAMVVVNLKRQRSVLGSALIAGAAVWSFMFMLNAGMRMAAPSFMWGLTFAIIVNRRQNQYFRRSDSLHKKV